MEPLSTQLVAIAAVYGATYLLLDTLTPLIPAEKHRQTLWAFHFIIASLLAVLLRKALGRLRGPSPLHDELLTRIGATTVDITTVCALAAVQISVLGDWFAPVFLITGVGGVATLLVCVWLGRRAFPQAPLQHVAVLFGAMTGTATTGLALLRMLDPDLKGPVARNYVLAATGAAALALPLFLLIPKPVVGWPGDYPNAQWVTLGLLSAYLVVVVILWTKVGALKKAGAMAFSLAK